MTYRIHSDTGHAWVELCDAREPHINGIGMPVARVADDDLAHAICALLNQNGEQEFDNLQDEIDYLSFHAGRIMEP